MFGATSVQLQNTRPCVVSATTASCPVSFTPCVMSSELVSVAFSTPTAQAVPASASRARAARRRTPPLRSKRRARATQRTSARGPVVPWLLHEPCPRSPLLWWGMATFVYRIQMTCPECGEAVMLDGPVRRAECLACREKLDIAGEWKAILDFPARAKDLGLDVGQTRGSSLSHGELKFLVRWGPADPACAC